jgi:hypothetical protein
MKTLSGFPPAAASSAVKQHITEKVSSSFRNRRVVMRNSEGLGLSGIDWVRSIKGTGNRTDADACMPALRKIQELLQLR